MPAKFLLASPAVRKPRCKPVSARQGKCRPNFYWPPPRFGNHGVICLLPPPFPWDGLTPPALGILAQNLCQEFLRKVCSRNSCATFAPRILAQNLRQEFLRQICARNPAQPGREPPPTHRRVDNSTPIVGGGKTAEASRIPSLGWCTLRSGVRALPLLLTQTNVYTG